MARIARFALAWLALLGACSGVPTDGGGSEAAEAVPASLPPEAREEADPEPAQISESSAQAAALPRVRPAPAATAAPPAARPAAEPLAWGETSAKAAALVEARFPLHGVAFHVQAQVHRHAEMAELPIGYLRRGAVFRAARVEGGRGCRKGWYALASGGFVCQGDGVVIGKTPQRFDPSSAPPRRFDGMPYRYAKNLARDAHQYWRVPTEPERSALVEQLAELDALAAAEQEALGTAPAVPGAPNASVGDPSDGGGSSTSSAQPGLGANTPEEAAEDAQTPGLPEPLRMRMDPGFYVSLDRGYDPAVQNATDEASGVASGDAAAYLRTVRGAFVRNEHLRDATEPLAPGRSLRDGTRLPLGFVFMKGVEAYRRHPLTGARIAAGMLERLSALELSSERAVMEGKPYRIARDGRLVREHLVRVAERRERPSQVRRGARWIHVRLSTQTLVAYDGDQPVFATVVSSGKEGHETPTGLFRIHTKHVSTTMDGMAGTDDAYSIEDVPWTLYFFGSYALHGAFWHDRFGIVRSHGCVNLAPGDARWLFSWTTPEVPASWHGAVAPADALGTYVLVEE